MIVIDVLFPLVFPLALVIYIISFFYRYAKLGDDSSALIPDQAYRIGGSDEYSFSGVGYSHRLYPMEARDIMSVVLITAIYAAAAFFMLGENTAPQNFCHYEERSRFTLVELKQPTLVTKIMYYTGLYMGDYYLQFSADGDEYADICEINQGHADLFKWKKADLSQADELMPVRFIRIIAGSELEMGELAIFDEYGDLIPTDMLIFDAGTAPLFDEQHLIPNRQSFLNSSYFDEIYHARTAYENVRDIYPYEISHPPLGKLIISLGIRLFGMTPFGWRFMGVLFGVLMLPVIYIFIKNMFGSSAVSACGTIVFSFDFMHFTQTRIATIDTYSVFFILLMYLFMYRFASFDGDDPLKPRRGAIAALFLSGLFFGLGAASKWTCIYAGGGLALIWLTYWVFRGRAMSAAGQTRRFIKELFQNILLCTLFFIVIPLIVYYLSYYPYGTSRGLSAPNMFFQRDYLNTVLDNQKFMFSYHSGVDAEHPYSSRWYQWILNLRPILYYLDTSDPNAKIAFGAILSPLLCWGGLFAVISMSVLVIKNRDSRALFILIGYFAQLAPWILVERIVFEYHYFPSSVFLTLALCHVFNTVRRKDWRWKPALIGFAAVSVILFVAFYPVLSGYPSPYWYNENFLRWLPSWPF